MAYPSGYWAELVRSSSASSLVAAAAGQHVWLRTSDGLPLEQQEWDGTAWTAVTADTDEPDYVGPLGHTRSWRARKAGEAWIPGSSGIRFVDINWPNSGVHRLFFNPPAPTVVNAGRRFPRNSRSFSRIRGIRSRRAAPPISAGR